MYLGTWNRPFNTAATMHHEHVVKSPETQESEPKEWSGESIPLYFFISQPLVNGVFNSLPRNGSPTNAL